MGNDRNATIVGDFITDRMRELGMKNQAALGRASATSDSTISRFIYTAGYGPDHETCAKVARGLWVDADEFARFVNSGGRGPEPTRLVPVEVETTEYGDLIEDVRLALADDSPLTSAEKAGIAFMIDRAVGPERKRLHRPVRPSGADRSSETVNRA